MTHYDAIAYISHGIAKLRPPAHSCAEELGCGPAPLGAS
jgi:hypothetical protein